MSECVMVALSPQVSVMFQNDKPIRVFIDINAVSEEVNGLVETAKEILNKSK